MRRSKVLLGIILVAVMLAACDSSGSPTATPVGPAATPTTFILETSGTIAGIRQTLNIGEARNASFKDGDAPEKTSTVPEQQYAAMVEQVAKADFFNLEEKYDSGTVSDDRYYKLTVKQGPQSKTVTIAEIGGKDLTPQALSDLITMLLNVQNGMTPTDS